jgi:hypothetical protein
LTLRVTPSAWRLAGITATARPRRPPTTGVYTPFTPTDSLLSLPVRAEGGSGLVVIRGQMATPTACYSLAGATERTGSVITLAVQARPTGDDCLAGFIGAQTYKVTVRRIPAGSYTVRVVHAYRDGAWRPSMAMDSSGVTVR